MERKLVGFSRNIFNGDVKTALDVSLKTFWEPKLSRKKVKSPQFWYTDRIIPGFLAIHLAGFASLRFTCQKNNYDKNFFSVFYSFTDMRR